MVTTSLDTCGAVVAAAAAAPASASAGATSASTGGMDKAASAQESTIQEVSEFFVGKCIRLTMASKTIKHCSRCMVRGVFLPVFLEVLIVGWTAQLQATMPQAAVHPSAQEVGEMAQQAGEVVRLLEEPRRMSLGGMEERGKGGVGVEASAGSADGGGRRRGLGRI